MTKRTLAALGVVLAFAAVLVVVPASTDEAEAHPRTKTVQRCSYDPFAGQQCWTDTVNVSHVHRCGAGLTGTYPNCYPIPPATQPVCPAGMTGTPPNCYPPPPATTEPPPPSTTAAPPPTTIFVPPTTAPPPPSCPPGQHSNGGAGRNCHTHSFTPPCGTGLWSPGHGHTYRQRSPCMTTTTTTPPTTSTTTTTTTPQQNGEGECLSGTFVSGDCQLRENDDASQLTLQSSHGGGACGGGGGEGSAAFHEHPGRSCHRQDTEHTPLNCRGSQRQGHHDHGGTADCHHLAYTPRGHSHSDYGGRADEAGAGLAKVAEIIGEVYVNTNEGALVLVDEKVEAYEQDLEDYRTAWDSLSGGQKTAAIITLCNGLSPALAGYCEFLFTNWELARALKRERTTTTTTTAAPTTTIAPPTPAPDSGKPGGTDEESSGGDEVGDSVPSLEGSWDDVVRRHAPQDTDEMNALHRLYMCSTYGLPWFCK